VILEEIHMYEDHPPFGADEKCRALHFGSHPLGHSVLGTLGSIGSLSAEAMRQYHRARYAPGNISLVAAGRVDFETLVRSAQRYCGDWEASEATRAVVPAQTHPGFHVLCKESATQQYAVQLAAAPAAADPDRYPAKLLAAILGDETGSRLFWELVDPGLAETATLAHAEYDGAGSFLTYLSCQPDQAAQNLQRILDVYRQAERHGVTPDELQQAKNKVRARIVLASERPRGRLFAIGSDWIQRRQYRSVRDDLEAVAAITLDDLAAVLAKYPLSTATTITIGPLREVSPPQ